MIKRLKPIVPVLLGPQIPRKVREETQERYSRAIATLFIPWRSVKDLCAVNQSWREALASREESISTESNLADNNQTSTISHLSAKEQLYQDEALRSLHVVGRFSNSTRRDQPSMTSASLSHFSVKTQHSVQQNTAWQAAMKSDALRRRQQSILEDAPSPL
ncbi:unnamed protein product, partial [Adineta steineri]